MVKKKVKKKIAKKKPVKRIPKKRLPSDKKFLGIVGLFIGLLLISGFFPIVINLTGMATTDRILGDIEAGTEIGKNTAIQVTQKILTPLIEFLLGSESSGEYFFVKVWFLIIIFGIGFIALSKSEFFSEHRNYLYIIVSGVSILAVRTLGDTKIIETILLPYTAIGIAIPIGITFAFWFFVVNKGLSKQAPIVRRIAWIFFGVVLFGLWITRRDLIEFSWIYPASALLALLMAWWDGTINKFLIDIDQGKRRMAINQGAIGRLTDDLAALSERLRVGGVEIPQYETEKTKIENKIKILFKG